MMADPDGEDPGEVVCYSEQSGMEEEQVRKRYYKEVMDIFMRDRIDELQLVSPAPSASVEQTSQHDDVSDLGAFHKQIDVCTPECSDGHSVQHEESDSIPTASEYEYSFESCSEIIDPIESDSQEDEADSDYFVNEVDRVIEQVPGTDRDQLVKKMRLIRLKYDIQWAFAAGTLFLQLIKSALRVNHASESEYNKYIEDMFMEWKDTLKFFLPTKISEMDALYKLQAACLNARQSFPVYPKILSCLYKYNILSQRTIVYWANSAGWKYGPNETFLKESSKIIEGIKVGPYNHDKYISLYGSEDEYEGERFDEECTSEA